MRESYPFKGLIRWAVLPALIVAAGAAVALVEDLLQSVGLGPWVSLAVGAAFVFPVGLAMAVGRRPAVSVLLSFLLGALSLFAGQVVITELLRLRASFDARPLHLAAMGAAAGLGTLAHHVYLRARGLGKVGITGGVLFYLLAATAGARLASVLDANPAETSDYLRRGVVGGAFQWLAMIVALQVAGRVSSAGPAGETFVRT